ncbi:MAG: serine hydroxymethyltransferase [Thermodesulfobacteriota bacterium]
MANNDGEQFAENLAKADPLIAEAIEAEKERQSNTLLMIASENYTSRAVMEAQASVLTNKYAEGYPGNRYYGGCEHVDEIEDLAIDRARKLFQAEYANVQPHSGSQANMAVYFAVLEPGDVILSMDLAHGGHLTHGSRVSFSGTLYRPVFYGVDPQSHRLDYDQVASLAKSYHPKLIIAGASSYPRTIDFERFKQVADEVGAYLMADMAHIAGLIAAKQHPSPVPFADFITATTHKTLRGPRGGFILAAKNYERAVNAGVFPGMQGGPLMHVIAGKAVAFHEAMKPAFAEYQRQVVANAKVLAQELISLGLDVVTGGTDNHTVLLDLSRMNLSGLDAEHALDKAGINTNKNSIPFDKRKPKLTSGVRLGTPAATTRGMKEPEMKSIAGWIARVLENPYDDKHLAEIRTRVQMLCRQFPLHF